MPRNQFGLAPAQELFRQRCLRWAGHIARAPDDGLLKQVTFGWLQGGSSEPNEGAASDVRGRGS